MLTNYDMYGPYEEAAKNGSMELDTKVINKDNLDEHFMYVLNLFRDGIETDEMRTMRINVLFADGIRVPLCVQDYWFNLMFWNFAVDVDQPITSQYLFYGDITKKYIKEYIDNNFIRRFRTQIPSIKINNIIDNCLNKFKYINEFSLYLANTVNLEDTLDMMRTDPKINDIMHLDLTGVSLADVKSEGMKATNVMINKIKESPDHCLKDSFIAQEAINPKQFKEVQVSIGSKPDGRGGVFPYVVNNSFLNGGVSNPASYMIDSSTGRTAQILTKMNVGTSGSFARLLGINNTDTDLNPDPNYSCHTRNYEKVFIKDKTWLEIYDMRYYKFRPDGPQYLLDAARDKNLIGQILYFRSPMTCESLSEGTGICRFCYGDLYFINRDINPGMIASEQLSSKYTQILLSAKHLLESMVVKMNWSKGFSDYFVVNMNTIALIEDKDYSDTYMIINPDYIEEEDEDDDDLEYNQYLTSFSVLTKSGKELSIHTADDDPIYITDDLTKILTSKKVQTDKDGRYIIPMDKMIDIPAIFMIHVQNKELARTLDKTKHILNKSQETSKYDRDSILTELITTNLEGGIKLNAVHLEVLLANQIRNATDILDKPDWSIPNAKYQILTLGSALTNNPSITVSLEYQRIASTLVKPISGKKTKPSKYDPFFKLQPQDIMNNGMVSDDYILKDDDDGNMRQALHFYNADGEEIQPIK